MKEKFADLGKTYEESEPGQRRVLLGVRKGDFALSVLNANTIEPILLWIFKLMDAYKSVE